MKELKMSDRNHALMSPIASMDAQLQLLKRSKEYITLPDKTKESIERLNEKLTALQIRLKAFLSELE